MCYHRNNKNRIYFLFILIFLFNSAYGLPSDHKKPIHIISNSAQLNKKTGVSIFTGEVKVTQGTTHLTGNKVVLHTNTKNQLISAVAYGTLAHYWTLPQVNKAEVYSRAKIIKYFPPQHKIILIGQANVKQKENNFHGPKIIYNTQTQMVTSTPTRLGRTTMVINPQQPPGKATT